MFYQKFFNFLFSLFLCTCGQDISSKKEITVIPNPDRSALIIEKILQLGDTSKIIILPLDTLGSLPFPEGVYSKLTINEFKTIDILLRKCIYANNHHQDTTKHILEFIDLEKYKRQYIPFTDSKGEKKVFVNCFCADDPYFDYWKKDIVFVDDGGSCFFHVIINLSTGSFEELFINGYA